MLANNQLANKSESHKKELNFDFVLEQLLSMSKNLPFLYNFWSLKTFAPKPKNKSKSYSNKTYLYCSKPGHNNHSYYYKQPKKRSDTFWEKQNDKISKLKRIAGNKNSKKKLGTFGLHNVWEFITINIVTHITNSSKDNKYYFDNTASFHMNYDLANFKDWELIQWYKDDIIWSVFDQEKKL